MSRGFKKDIAATESAYKRGLLIDAKHRSFISQPKLIPGENDEPEPHMLLWGADKTAARMKLFQREKSRCQKCGRIVTWNSGPYGGEWMHERDKPWNKCDCPANASLRCHEHHQGPGTEHYKRRPRFGVEKVSA